MVRSYQSLRSCHGRHVLLGGEPGPGVDPAIALAGLFTSEEATGAPVVSVSVRLARRADADWADAAVRWLHGHGRRVIMRTSVVLPRSLLQALRECDATVQYELAHHRRPFQRALLGAAADAAAALLLQAQHLNQLGVGVVGHLGPVFPGISAAVGAGDHACESIEALLRHVAAADVRDVHVSPGVLTAARLAAIEPLLDLASKASLRRAFGLGRDQGPSSGPWRLRRFTRRALLESVASLARDNGLTVDACGCGFACHLDPNAIKPGVSRPGFVSFKPRELFALVSPVDQVG
ncbi:MAG: hypothetical protein KC468_16320 [Myxococcales bacterium]|nr:hypothetical protein [Myxococcales bacterium]